MVKRLLNLVDLDKKINFSILFCNLGSYNKVIV